MKTFLIFFALLLSAATQMSAQGYRLYWKYKDYDGAIAVTVPGLLVDAGSLFLKEKEDRKLLRKVNKVRTLVFEEKSPVTERDMKRFMRRAKRRHLEDLVLVREGNTHVRVMAKERRNRVKKLVIFVQSPEEFVFVSVNGRLRLDDIMRVAEKYGKDIKGKKEEKPIVPPVLKVPVSRV